MALCDLRCAVFDSVMGSIAMSVDVNQHIEFVLRTPNVLTFHIAGLELRSINKPSKVGLVD